MGARPEIRDESTERTGGRYSVGVGAQSTQVRPGRLVLAVAFALVLSIPFFWRLGDEEFHGDESHWISSGQEALALVTSGRLDDPLWREQFYLYSQPQVGKL